MTEPGVGAGHTGGEREGFWRDFLAGENSRERRLRRVLRLLPSDPRCQMCAAPFAGAAAPLMRAFGKRRSERNPKWCNSCFAFMSAHQGGAEVTCTLLFADIRGSTALAERMSPSEFSRLLDRFYNAATSAVFDNDGMVDKFVGDELVAMFFPLLSGERHAARAIDAARALLLATGHAQPEGPWASVGAGVHTGPVWVGTIGTAGHVELTAVGDSMNTTARLASIAEAGEILVTRAAAEAAALDAQAPARAIDLRGKTETIEVVSLRVSG